jgi:aryl-alcohol dehydrogenase-like predicted oxidoreductase
MNATFAASALPPLAAPTIELPLIGKSAFRVGFGTGGLMRISSARQRQDALAAALASGITHFDTAPLYGFGESERALGRFLRGRRSKVTLTTKFGLQPSALAARLALLQGVARRAIAFFPALRRTAVRNSSAFSAAPFFSRAAAAHSLEKSLRALRTDYVDFFLAHQASAAALPDQDLLGWLEDVRRAGKIRAYGVATDFECLLPVLRQRPQLSRVVQFDCDLARGRAGLPGGSNDHLLITYGFVGRAIATCRERIASFNQVSDDELGGMLLRAAVLANPNGLVLMQSRSIRRIESNARAATIDRDDERVRELVQLLESQR